MLGQVAPANNNTIVSNGNDPVPVGLAIWPQNSRMSKVLIDCAVTKLVEKCTTVEAYIQTKRSH